MPDDGRPENAAIHMAPRAKKQGFKPTLAGVARVLKADPELGQGEMFKHDTFSGQTQMLLSIPRQDEPAKPHKPRPTTDLDVSHLMIWLEHNGAKGKVGSTIVERAIQVEGHRNAYSSARQALDRLPVWDGVYRLDRFWEAICGAVAAEDEMSEEEIWARSRYLTATARCFFISIVARILTPGCKVDTMVILEGPQGSLKSTLLRVLAFDNPSWFSDSMVPDLKNKDARAHLAGKLIVEFAELTQLHGSRAETMKMFLSAQDDKFRPAYGRGEVDQPRQCVFVGTTNASDYLVDPTGNRRFWPIKCGKIDIKRAKAERDQLYAEALDAWRKGERWWLPDDLEMIAAAEQRARLTDDAWERHAQRAIEEAINLARASDEPWAWVTTTDVMDQAKVESAQQDGSKMQRAGRLLTKLGGKHGMLPKTGKFRRRGYRFDLPNPAYPV